MSLLRLSSQTEEALRKVTTFFVENILLLEGTIARLSEERFGGHPILFTDSVEKLNCQLTLADQALEHFNLLAKVWNFAELSKDDISSGLTRLIELEAYRKILIAEVGMLGTFGEPAELRTNFNRFAATYSDGEMDSFTRGTS